MMTDRFRKLKGILDDAIGRVMTAASAVVVWDGEVVFQHATGLLDPNVSDSRVSLDSLFDFASLTKLFTATMFLQLAENEVVELDAPVSSVLLEFAGHREIEPFENPLAPGDYIRVEETRSLVDASLVTFRHLLTHSGGLPGWKPLYKLGNPEAIREAVVSSNFAYTPGTRVVYSDLGFMLLGWSIEVLTNMRLEQALSRYITLPYEMKSIQYGPVPAEAAAATEFCKWRGRRMRGEVHDENSWALGGVSGHAGLFGNAMDLAKFGKLWLDAITGDPSLLGSELAHHATTLQMEHGTLRRGLGWALWSPSPSSPSHPLSKNSFGHTGFTGTSLYIDPDRMLVIALLTNRVYFGRDGKGIRDLRLRFHTEVVEATERSIFDFTG